MNNQELDVYINKFDNKRITNITEIEQISLFNYLKELKMYRNLGTLSELYDINSKHRKLVYGYELQSDIISTLEKSNQNLSDRVVKVENLISESIIN